MKEVRYSVFLALLVLATAGCGPTPPPLAAGPVALIPLQEGAISDPWQSGLDSTRVVIRSAREWADLWAPVRGRTSVPSIDFSHSMLLVVASGERPSHAWTVIFDSAWVARDTLFVAHHEHVSCSSTGMLVRPVGVFAVPVMGNPVRFLYGGRRGPCSTG